MPGKGKPFQKGHTTPGGGRPKVPDDLKIARALTRMDVEILLNAFLGMSKEALRAASADPRLSVLDHIVLGIVQKAILHGDQKRLEFLLDYTVGPIPTKVDLKTSYQQDSEKLSEDELISKVKQQLAVLEAAKKEKAN